MTWYIDDALGGGPTIKRRKTEPSGRMRKESTRTTEESSGPSPVIQRTIALYGGHDGGLGALAKPSKYCVLPTGAACC